MDIDIFFDYSRKSSDSEDRQAKSIESQQEINQETAQRLGLKVVDRLWEAKTAKVPGREVFNSMVERIKNREANGIIVWHPDRISRNGEDLGKILGLIDEGFLKSVVTPTQTFHNNPMDKFMLGFMMLQAKLENDKKGEDVKRGLETKAKMGWLPSGAKPGYKNDKYAEKGNKKLLPDPQRFPLIRRAWDMLLTGTYSVMDILRTLNDKWGYRTPKKKKIGGKPMTRSQIYELFRDPFYYGEFEYPVGSGNWYQGKHKKMITKDEFDKAQLILGVKGRPRPKTRTFDYTGLITCGECGAFVTAEEKYQVICSECKYKFSSLNRDTCPKCQIKIEKMSNPTRLHYIYYHCTKRKKKTCAQKSIRKENLEKQLDWQLGRIEIPEIFKNWAIKYLNEVADKETEDRQVTLESLQMAYDDVVKRIDSLVRLKIAPQNTDGSLLTDDEFKDQKQALIREKASVKEKLEDLDGRVDEWVQRSAEAFDFACHARHQFQTGDRQTKRELLARFGSDITLLNGTLLVNVQKPLERIRINKNKIFRITERLEPKEKTELTPEIEALYYQNPSMLPGSDSNRQPTG